MSNPPQSKHQQPITSTSAKMKQQLISPTKNTTPNIRQQQQPKKKEDKTPAEQLFHWLTTPPEIAFGSHQEQQRRKTKQLAEYRKRQQQKQKQQQDLTKNKTRQQHTVATKTATEQFISNVNLTKKTTNLQQRQQSMKKEFGPSTPSQHNPKPKASVISVPGLDMDLDPPVVDLPSHVPTPATIDEILMVPTSDQTTLLGEKVEGVIDKTLDFIFDTNFSQKSDSKQYKTHKDERLHNPGVIKYAPSLETPPQSPVARKHLITSTSKLLRTPPSVSSSSSSSSSSSQTTTSATKWGPEIWQAKKSNSSPTHSVTFKSSPSLGDLSVSSGITFNLSDVSKQEHLLREAMARKQKKAAAIRKIHPTSPKNIDGSRRSLVVTTLTGTSANQTIRTDCIQHATESTHMRTTTLSSVPTPSSSTTQSASSTGPTTRSTVTTASNNTTPSAPPTTHTTNSMQLLWMYQNSLNLQTSCNPRRGSIRYIDGEYTNGGGGGGGKGNGTRKSLTMMAAGPLVFKHHDPNPAHDEDKEDDDKGTVIDDIQNGDDHDEGGNGIGSIPPQTTRHAVAA